MVKSAVKKFIMDQIYYIKKIQRASDDLMMALLAAEQVAKEYVDQQMKYKAMAKAAKQKQKGYNTAND